MPPQPQQRRPLQQGRHQQRLLCQHPLQPRPLQQRLLYQHPLQQLCATQQAQLPVQLLRRTRQPAPQDPRSCCSRPTARLPPTMFPLPLL